MPLRALGDLGKYALPNTKKTQMEKSKRTALKLTPQPDGKENKSQVCKFIVPDVYLHPINALNSKESKKPHKNAKKRKILTKDTRGSVDPDTRPLNEAMHQSDRKTGCLGMQNLQGTLLYAHHTHGRYGKGRLNIKYKLNTITI